MRSNFKTETLKVCLDNSASPFLFTFDLNFVCITFKDRLFVVNPIEKPESFLGSFQGKIVEALGYN
jgi:hypothetical protein